jgi:hypothetical protein
VFVVLLHRFVLLLMQMLPVTLVTRDASFPFIMHVLPLLSLTHQKDGVFFAGSPSSL